MKLIQTFEEPIYGYFNGGPLKVFPWSIDCSFEDGKSRIGSWTANYFFEVKTGKSEKQTLANARRVLMRRARKAGKMCTFTYEED